MRWLSDGAVDRLRDAAQWPDLTGTRYEAVELVGRGGMGAVYRVRDTVLGRDVAMKVLDLPEGSRSAAARLRREAEVLARLEHPGIVPIHDFGELPDGRSYYVMKLVRGRRLDALAAETPDLGERLRVFGRICEAVAFAHSHGVVHRDLKPENVMVGPFGEVLVLDWGVAKVLVEACETADGPSAGVRGSRDTAHGTVVGTPGYMAPEQERGEVGAVDRRADVYALGAILTFLIGGERTPVALRAVCEKAMAEDPAARYDDAGAVGLEIGRYLNGLAVGAHAESPVEAVARLARRHRVAIALVAAYIALRMLLFFFTRF